MPYSSLTALPDPVKALPKPLQELWMAVFNSALKEYGDEGKAHASAWAKVNAKREDIHPNFRRIKELFTQRYGLGNGTQKYEAFLGHNNLNPTLSYRPDVQGKLRESFQWAKSNIQYLKQDTSAKYYQIQCLHAIVSMNDKDYSDPQAFQQAGESMNYRPVNINHDYTRWVQYPRTRLDYSKAEDLTLEGILRVDNQDKWLQEELDHDPNIPQEKWIWEPSIEGRPNLDGKGFHFTGIALLEQGYALPGDPLSEIAPLFTESVGQSTFVKFTVDEENQSKVKDMTEQEPAPKENWSEESLKDKDGNYLKDRVTAAVTAFSKTPKDFPPNVKDGICRAASAMKIECQECSGGPSKEDLEVVRAKQNAEAADAMLKVEREKEALSEDNHKLRTELIEANKRLSEQSRQIAEGLEFKKQIGDKSEELAKTTTKLNESIGVATQKDTIIQSKEQIIQQTNKQLEEQVIANGKLVEANKQLRKELAESAGDVTTAKQMSINETRERQVIQEENSGLRGKVAELMHEISRLTESRSGDSKKLIALEAELSRVKKECGAAGAKYEAQIAETSALIESARKYAKWANKEMEKAGIVIVKP